MIAVAFTEVERTPDEVVKLNAVVKQMNELMTRLDGGAKYYTLSLADRQLLVKEGYASDLVDNLVYSTQRFVGELGVAVDDSNNATYIDELVTGFTYAAFDPSLYASASVAAHFKQLSQGCCIYCETFLAATDSGSVCHFRPVFNLQGRQHSWRSPYFSLAYAQHNLVYSCKACSEQHKADHFPLKGQRYPAVELAAEQHLLINPYFDDPRQFIRFNPLNGHAYAFDSVRAFYQQTLDLTDDQIEQLLWQDPSNIPLQIDHHTGASANPQVDHAYQQWVAGQNDSCGSVSIAILGLNRPALLLSRCGALNQLKLGFSAFSSRQTTKSLTDPITSEAIATHQYRSLAVDAFNYWRLQKHSPTPSVDLTDKIIQPEKAPSKQPQQVVVFKPTVSAAFPSWFRSSLIYFVAEPELTLANKRRLVCLSARDSFYGSNQKDKCVFLAVDWQGDQHNVIKVRSKRNTWETSFTELSRSRPLELSNLFANNEVWVEGRYPPLAVS